MNEVLKTISERRSIRAYDPTPIPEADMQAILTAALEAPTARNLQLWHFSVITNTEVIEKLDEAIAPGKHPCYHAPAVIVISVPKDYGFFAPIDCGIAVQNIALASWSLGYGNVILGMPRVAFTGEKADEMKAICGVPADNEFMIAIALGKATASKDAHELHPEKIGFVK